ncbi:hypothetical protein ACSSVY_004424, partial [Roseovarius sp. MBR-51]
MPGQQFIQPVDLVIMDAVEDVSEICQRVEAVKFSGLDDGHGAGRFCRKKSIDPRTGDCWTQLCCKRRKLLKAGGP